MSENDQTFEVDNNVATKMEIEKNLFNILKNFVVVYWNSKLETYTATIIFNGEELKNVYYCNTNKEECEKEFPEILKIQ